MRHFFWKGIALALGTAMGCDHFDAPKYGAPGDSDDYRWTDVDGDGYGESEDCDDQDPSVHPGAAELCDDGVDNDCDGETDEDDCQA